MTVIVTTSLNPQDLKKTHTYPVAAYLPKPLTEENVGRLLATHFYYSACCLSKEAVKASISRSEATAWGDNRAYMAENNAYMAENKKPVHIL